MRPTGSLHLGHYHGVLKNWVRLQHEYPCLFFVADWHALTTQYDDPRGIAASTFEMVIDWLAAGVDPEKAILFVQSHVLEHAELHLLLSMSTPLGWLERVPTYKDQQEKLASKDLTTYGFLGYPLLMSADILIYRADKVPVGEDQIPHVEITREFARRFNHLYGRGPDFEEKVKAGLKKLGSRKKALEELRLKFQQDGDKEAVAEGRALLAATQHLSAEDREVLVGHLEGTGRTMREDEASVTQKVKRMPTDPARVRRTDVGNPEKCPVWQLHQVYSDAACKDWVQKGCRSAGIGCLECKQPVIDSILREQAPMRERAQIYLDHPQLVRDILIAGRDKATVLARETMRDVREAMGLVL